MHTVTGKKNKIGLESEIMTALLALVRLKAGRLREIYRQRGLRGVTEKLIHRFLLVWWYEILWLRRRQMNHDGYAKATGEFGTLLVHPTDPGISKELLVHRTHEPIGTELIKGLLRDGMVAIDIGSNIGYYVLLESRQIGEHGRIIAIEPAPRNIELLTRNIALNALRGVTVVEGAVGDRDGLGTLHISHLSNLHSMYPSEATEQGTVEVKMYRLDTLVQNLQLRRVDFVRMDIEGYEVNALDGMLETLKKYKPQLVIELHPLRVEGRKIVSLLRVLKSLGYEAKHVVERPLDQPWVRHRNGCRVEIISIEDLMADPRLANGTEAVTGFFEATGEL